MGVRIVEYDCPACGQLRRAPAEIAGQSRKCQYCGQATVVPDSAACAGSRHKSVSWAHGVLGEETDPMLGLEGARRVGSFHVGLIPWAPGRIRPQQELPIHDQVLRPVLARAVEVRVYGLQADYEFLHQVTPILTRHRGAWNVRLDRDPIRGFEPLWNDDRCHDGIVIAAPLAPADAEPIFRHCSVPGTWGSVYQLYQGTSRAAIRHCQRLTERPGMVAFCISGSNCLEWLDIFAADDLLQELYRVACRCGRSWKEHGAFKD